MQEVNRNDEAVFNKLYKQYKTTISRYIAIKIYNKEIAEELTQDVFIKVATNLHRFDENKSAFSTWIYNIAQRTLFDYFRKTKMQTISIEKSDMGYETNTSSNILLHSMSLRDGNKNPLEQLILDESTNAVKEAINSLPSSEKQIMILYAFNSKTYEEIATILDIPIGTVKGTIHRARFNLKHILEPATIY